MSRWADQNQILVTEFSGESKLDPIPHYREIVLTWDELHHLSPGWKKYLGECRGIYCIHDAGSNVKYVGSAYAANDRQLPSGNMLHRCLNYKDSRDGGNKYLRLLDPRNFRFSILQRVEGDTTRD